MYFFTAALTLLATLELDVEAKTGFTTVTTMSPLQTRGLDIHTAKKHCNRLAVCAVEIVSHSEPRSPKKQKDSDNYKPKYPIIFDVSTGSRFSLPL